MPNKSPCDKVTLHQAQVKHWMWYTFWSRTRITNSDAYMPSPQRLQRLIEKSLQEFGEKRSVKGNIRYAHIHWSWTIKLASLCKLTDKTNKQKFQMKRISVLLYRCPKFGLQTGRQNKSSVFKCSQTVATQQQTDTPDMPTYVLFSCNVSLIASRDTKWLCSVWHNEWIH